LQTKLLCLCLYRGDQTRHIQIQSEQGAYSTRQLQAASGLGYQAISELGCEQSLTPNLRVG